MSWSKIALGSAIRVKHGFAFKGEHFSDTGTHVVLTPGNFFEEGGFRVRPGKDRYYAAAIPDDYVLREGDLIVAMTEQAEGLLGSSALIPDNDRYLHNQRLGLVEITDKNLFDASFLFHVFNLSSVRGQIAGSASGTKVRHTAPERIYKVQVRIPDISQQKRIAQTIRAYDDLIENNRRRIQLLEQSALLLYREWFVHLRFPGHEHVRVVDGVPEGWERVSLCELCADIRDAVKPEKVETDAPYIGLEHIPRRSITLDDWGKAGDVQSQKFRFIEGDILFGKIRPYFHKVGFTLTDGITSSDAVVIRPAEKRLRFFVLHLVASDQFVAVASKTVKEGSKMPRADWKFLKTHKVASPPEHLLVDFNDVCGPITTQLKTLALQTRKLREARDLLLPRLMSGEITV